MLIAFRVLTTPLINPLKTSSLSRVKGAKMKRQPIILCIDSDSDACEIMEILMSRIGFQVISSHSVHDAIKHARNTPFSIIISEYLLRDVDALQMCLAIKEFDPHVPIVFYSAESRKEHKERGINAGAHAYLVKPNDLENIEQTVLNLALT
jgi:DNA-binding response OmpR family regulator